MIGLVDLHAHPLPGIDDGPADIVGALAFARAAAGSGISTLAATPHLRSDFPNVHVSELGERCQAFREALAQESIDLELVSGAEVSLAWALEAGEKELVLASYDQRGSDLLIETPAGPIVGLAELLFQVRARGFRVTLAHPERSQAFQDDAKGLEELVRQGVVLQVNASSLLPTGRGSRLHTLARRLCLDGLAHVLASDGHRADSWRPVTMLSAAATETANLVGVPRAQWMARDIPAAILAGEKLPEPPPADTQRRRRSMRW